MKSEPEDRSQPPARLGSRDDEGARRTHPAAALTHAAGIFAALGLTLVASPSSAQPADALDSPAPPPGYEAQPPAGYGYGPAPEPIAPRPGAVTYAAPPGPRVHYVEEERNLRGLWIAGMVIFPASYALTSTLANDLAFGGSYADFSFIPLIGPWLMLGEARGDAEIAGALFGGIGQLAGATLFILGLTLKETVQVARYALDTGPRAPELLFEVAPALGGGMIGARIQHF